MLVFFIRIEINEEEDDDRYYLKVLFVRIRADGVGMNK